jgi:arginine/lysine/ornithine decarboxylase
VKVDQSKTPLLDAIRTHREKEPISFHVPGHKNGLLIDEENASAFYRNDLTELSGLDDLHDPKEAVLEAEGLLSDYYGSERSFLLVNGSTVGNMAAILAACSRGDIVLVQRNCHKSVLNGIKLAKAEPVLVETEWDADGRMPLGVSLEAVRETLKAYPHAKACVLTYPTYYGHTYDIESIMEELHRHDVTCIIDEAHGPHFKLGSPFPRSALDMGGDIVIHSAHKMLPAMTMGSYLHIGSDRVNQQKVQEYLSMLQSSSPSYPIMASLDYARSYIGTLTEDECKRNIEGVLHFVQALKQAHAGLGVIRTHDPLKLLLRFKGKSGYELQALLESKGIFTELADPYYVLMILPLVKDRFSFPFEEAVARVAEALEHEPVQEEWPGKRYEKLTDKFYSVLSIDYEQMDGKEETWVCMDEAEGQIASQMVTPYPPGIPLLIPGEMISKKIILRLQEYVNNKANIQGYHRLGEGYVRVYR